MAVLSFLAAMAAFVTPIVVIGRWILGPIDRAAKSRQAPVRFSIADFLCLFLAVQIPLAAVYRFVGEDEEHLFWLFSVVSWVVAPVIWYACARALSKAGVMNGRYRFIFLGLVMPVVYYGLVPFVALTMIGIVGLLMGEPQQLDRYFVWMALVWVALAILFFFSGLYTRWMLRQAPSQLSAVEQMTAASLD